MTTIRSRLTPLAAALLACATAPALAQADPQVVGEETVVDHGDPANRFDIVFLGDGYAEDDLEAYRTQVDRVVALLRSTSPFKEYWAYLNVHRVDVVSPVSGHSYRGSDRTEVKETPFRVTYSDGLMYLSGDRRAIARTAARHAPDADAVVCFSNGGWGGRSWGLVAIVGGGASLKTTAHELGHSIGRLADEYQYMGELKHVPGDVVRAAEDVARPYLRLAGWEFPNVTARTRRGSIPWSHWIDADTPLPTTENGGQGVGLYEGAFYFSSKFYRPLSACLMDSHNASYCPPCREHIVLALSRKVVPYRWTSADTGHGLRLGFETIVPGPLRARWFVRGQELAAGTDSLLVDPDVVRRRDRVRLEVQDATPWVRRDEDRVLVHSHDWHVSGRRDLSVRRERTDRHRAFALLRWLGGRDRRLDGEWDRAGRDALLPRGVQVQGGSHAEGPRRDLGGGAQGMIAKLRASGK